MWTLLQQKQINGIFNLGTGNARTWNDLVTAVFTALGEEPNIEYIDMPEDIRNQYQYFTEAKMDKLQKAGVHYKFTALEDAVHDYVVNYLEKGEAFL